MELGEIIRDFRMRMGMSQTDFCIKSGLSSAWVSLMETNHKAPRPNYKTLYKVASVMGLEVKDLVKMMDDEEVDLKPIPVRIPVVGKVKAGLPLEAVENVIGYEEIPRDMGMSGQYFALKVQGDSMSPRICENDIVIVKKQNYIESGDIAIVLVGEDEATIKKVIKANKTLTLMPFNVLYEPMVFTKEQIETLPVTVIGKVVELRATL